MGVLFQSIVLKSIIIVKKINIDERTVQRYIDILESAKIIYKCCLFDIKSKNTCEGSSNII